MQKLFYPAIFHPAEEGGFWITFPDLPECMTQGDDMQSAYEMAVDALGLAITSRKKRSRKSLLPPFLTKSRSLQTNAVLSLNLTCLPTRNARTPEP